MIEQPLLPPPNEMPQAAMQEVVRTPKTQEEINVQVGRIANKLLARAEHTLERDDLRFGEKPKGDSDINLYNLQGKPITVLRVESPEISGAELTLTSVFSDGENVTVSKHAPTGIIRVDASRAILTVPDMYDSKGYKEAKLTRNQTIHATAGILSEVRGRLATHEKRTIEKNSQKIDIILKAR